jgi:hypothetical protein
MPEYPFRDHQGIELTINGTKVKRVREPLESGGSCTVTVYKEEDGGFIATIVCEPANQSDYWAKIVRDLGSIWTLEDLITELESEEFLYGSEFPPGVGVVIGQAAKELQAER